MDWAPLNLASAHDAINKWRTFEDRGKWFKGYHEGVIGSVLDDAIASAIGEAFAEGFACGVAAKADMDSHRKKVSGARSEAAKKRWNRGSDANAHPIADAIAYPKADAKGGFADANAMHKTRQDRSIPPVCPPGDNTQVIPGEPDYMATLGETERSAVAAWDTFALPLRCPTVVVWPTGRRRALSRLVGEFPNGMAFMTAMRKVLSTMARDQWVREQRPNIDHILDPKVFRRYFEAVAPAPRNPESPKPPADDLPPEVREANRTALLGMVDKNSKTQPAGTSGEQQQEKL